MIIPAINPIQLSPQLYKAKNRNVEPAKVFASKTHGLESIPYFYPVVNFKGHNTLSLNGIDSVPFDIPEEIISKGYKYYGNVRLMDEDGNSKRGYAFINDAEEPEASKHIKVLITDKEFDDLGAVFSTVTKNDSGEAYVYVDVINNYANTYNESRCVKISPIKGYDSCNRRPSKSYKKVGTESYRVLEEYLKDNYPEIRYIEACPVREGSLKFHEKVGFVYDRSHKVNMSQGTNKSYIVFDYYKKILNKVTSLGL